MGMLVQGVWHDVWYDTTKTGGAFVRMDSTRAIQLGLEYDPQPPFNSGSTKSATPETVTIVRERATAISDEPYKKSSELLTGSPYFDPGKKEERCEIYRTSLLPYPGPKFY